MRSWERLCYSTVCSLWVSSVQKLPLCTLNIGTLIYSPFQIIRKLFWEINKSLNLWDPPVRQIFVKNYCFSFHCCMRYQYSMTISTSGASHFDTSSMNLKIPNRATEADIKDTKASASKLRISFWIFWFIHGKEPAKSEPPLCSVLDFLGRYF